MIRLPYVLICALLIKMLIYPIVMADSVGLLALCSFCSFCLYLEQKKHPDPGIEFKKELELYKAELEVVKGAINSLKIGGLFNKR